MAKNLNSIWYMGGTEKTGQYNVLARTALGTMGVRELSDGRVRIRIEPTAEGAEALAKVFTRADGFKQPGDSGENRFSIVVDAKSDRAGYEAVVRKALHALVAGGNVPRVNPKGRAFARRMLTREALVEAVKARGVPGKSLASTWSTETLCKKLAA